MAGRAVLQVDQTTPAYQVLLWHFRECRQKLDLDCHLSVCARGNHQETPWSQRKSLYNSTDSESDPIRESAIVTDTYSSRLQCGRLH